MAKSRRLQITSFAFSINNIELRTHDYDLIIYLQHFKAFDVSQLCLSKSGI